MMNHFNVKSLAFYGIAIGSVLILFKVVTAYGEANAKAPPAIEGRYRLTLAQNLPNCPQSSNLLLDIQQSGIYLHGSLLPASSDRVKARAGEKKPALNGKLNSQQLNLAGTLPKSSVCSNFVAQPIALQSQVQGKNLTGQIALSGIPGIEFTAEQQAPTQPSGNSSSH